MFIIEDNYIYATRGDIVFFGVTAEDDGVPYHFQPGDILRIKVYGKKDAETVYLEKDFPVLEPCRSVEIYLTEEDTKFGEIISKPVDYWYEVCLNPDTDPQTIIGYSDEGAAVFRLFPEGADVEKDEHIPTEEDIPFVDEELDLTSPRPVANKAVARALAQIDAEYKQRTGELISNIHNSEGFIQKIVDVCKTYTDNFDKLVYGNNYTAYDAETKQVDGKWQLDCSSFQNLLIRGVTFENSRYGGGNNKTDHLFFNKFDPYEFRLANTMAKWLYDNGYTFEPAADFSNIEAGDLVFYSWPDTTGEFHENAFMHIDHVAMYLGKKNDSIYQTIQYEEYTPNFFYDASAEYMSSAVLVARLPFSIVENTGDNIALDSEREVSLVNSTGNQLAEYRLARAMIPGKMYTCCFKGRIETEGSYFLIHSSNYVTLISNNGEVWDGNEKEYKFSFICPELTDLTKLRLMCAGGSVRTAYAKNFCVYEGFKRVYTDTTIPEVYPILKEFDLADDVANDLESNMAASSYILEYKDCYILSLNIPLKTLRSGQLLLGSLGVRLRETRRLHANLVADEDGIISHYNGYLQISSGSATGEVYIRTWNSSHKYQYIMVNGMIAK